MNRLSIGHLSRLRLSWQVRGTLEDLPGLLDIFQYYELGQESQTLLVVFFHFFKIRFIISLYVFRYMCVFHVTGYK